MKFEKKMKLRRALIIAAIIMGVISVALGAIRMNLPDVPDFINYYFIIGFGTIAVGIIKLRRTIKALSDGNKLENLRIEERDEWNVLIRLKAAYYAFAATIITSYTLSLFLLFVDSGLFIPFMIANSILAAYYIFFSLVLRIIK
jgi:hypothetical protein